tara:strand:- start:908 stop:1315 length:408 start_codon:yes stop_codon:yes gene_type:complete
MASVGVRVQTGVKVEHTVGGYLVFARDQWPTVMGEVTCWGLRGDVLVGHANDEKAANLIAQSWKQSGQKWRRKCGEEALLQMPHRALPDPTPRQVQVLLDQLGQEKYHEWCTDEYSMAEEPSDDEEEEESVPGEI